MSDEEWERYIGRMKSELSREVTTPPAPTQKEQPSEADEANLADRITSWDDWHGQQTAEYCEATEDAVSRFFAPSKIF
jgi:hypothetical protein